MKTILVTGGAGFIGSHLCDFLLKRENKVIAVDNFVTGREGNVSHLLKNEDFELIELDICKTIELNEKLQGKKIDQIYNLASPASPKDFRELAIEIMLVNSLGTKNMLDSAVKNKAVFLEASTSEVYGDPLEHPQKENYLGNVSTISIRSPYDESKRFSEALVSAYARKFSLQVRIARIFNTFGGRMRSDDGRVVPNFITQALQNKKITVYGSGKQTRSLCYVSDMIEGLYALMNSSYSKPVNLGMPEEITMLELAEKIKQLTKSNSEIVFSDLPEDGPEKRKPDIALARKELQWQPKISLEHGLQKTIEWFDNSSKN